MSGEPHSPIAVLDWLSSYGDASLHGHLRNLDGHRQERDWNQARMSYQRQEPAVDVVHYQEVYRQRIQLDQGGVANVVVGPKTPRAEGKRGVESSPLKGGVEVVKHRKAYRKEEFEGFLPVAVSSTIEGA